MGATKGTGTTLYFQSSGFTCLVRSVSWEGIGARDSHRLTTPAHSFEVFHPEDVADNGLVKLKILYDPTVYVPPFAGEPEIVEVRLAGTYRWIATMFMVGWTWGLALEQLMEAEMVLKVSGAIDTDQLVAILNGDGTIVVNGNGDTCYVGVTI